jgi:RNA polymerase sigma-70 factor, ECF subfamily
MSSDAEPKQLLRDAKNGDAEAFGRLYTLYFTPVYRYVFLRVRDRALTEDITQTVFLKVYRSIDSFRVGSVSPLAFFFTVARNTIIDHWKKKQETVFGDLSDETEAPFDAPDTREHRAADVDRALATDRVRDALHALSVEQQEVLTLKFIAELSNPEIAETVGKSESAVRQLQSRGLRALRETLKRTDTEYHGS